MGHGLWHGAGQHGGGHGLQHGFGAGGSQHGFFSQQQLVRINAVAHKATIDDTNPNSFITTLL